MGKGVERHALTAQVRGDAQGDEVRGIGDGLMEERWLVTGGSGFIGTNLIEELLTRRHVVSNVDVVPPLCGKHAALWSNTSILDREATAKHIAEFRPHVVVHLAANTGLSSPDDPHAFDVNTIGVTNIIDAVRTAGTVRRLIVASSMLVCRLGYQPTHDQDYCPGTPYGESKVETERLVRMAQGLPDWILVRPTTIWGPWHERLRDEFLSRLRSGRYFHPARDCSRSYGYVGNVVHQFIAFAQAPRDSVNGRVFYVGDKPILLSSYVDGFSRRLQGRPARRVPYPLLKLLACTGDLLVKAGWKKFPLTSYRLANMTSDHVLDMSATMQVAGPPRFTLDEGVDLTCVWLDGKMNPSGSSVESDGARCQT